MLDIQQIYKSYPQGTQTFTALENINLHIPENSIYGIIGKSGAGKSTLLRCINRLESATSGKILLNDLDINTLQGNKLIAMRRQMGMIFQHFNLLRSRTAFDNIALALEISGHTKKQIQQKVQPLLELTELTDKAQAYPSQLSGGERQRVAIARALVNQPKLLLCDEATSALDPASTHNILNLLKKCRDELNLTIILITHEMDVIKRCCDYVASLEQGRLVTSGSVFGFFTSHYVNRQPLPEGLDQAKHPNLWRIIFTGTSAKEPIIAHLIKKLNIDVNILQADIEYIQEKPLGVMLLSMEAAADQLQSAKQYLTDNKVMVEQLS